MKRSEPKTFGQIFNEAMSQVGLNHEFDQQRASFLWGEIVGPLVNRHTTRRYIANGILHVYISSAPLRSELSFLTAALVKRINHAVGKDVVKSIELH